jgi:septal ring factor EnvC (AmiA/AmiB activator)
MLLAAMLFASPGWSADNTSTPDKQGQTQAELSDLRQRIKALQQTLESTRDQYAQTLALLRDVEQKIAAISKRLRELNETLQQHERNLDAHLQQRVRLEKELGRHKISLAKHARSAYAMGRQGFLKLVLNQQDPVLFGRVLAYYDYVNSARADRMADIDARVTELERLAQAIRTRQQHISLTKSSILQDKQVLEQVHEERDQLLAQLRSEIGTGEARLEQFRQDEQRLLELLEGLREVAKQAPLLAVLPTDDRKPFAAFKGRLEWPAHGAFLARFGSQRKTGRLKWQGVLIGAAEGSEVRAVSHGRVVFADWLRGFGLLVIVDHGEEYLSLYGHNRELYKKPGDWVEGGEPLASVGDSGGSARSGLYFEIRYKGQPVNPLDWCVNMAQRR